MTEASEDLAAGESKTAKSRRIIRRATRYVRLLVYAEPTTVDLILLTLGILAAIASGVPFPLMGIIFGQLKSMARHSKSSMSESLTLSWYISMSLRGICLVSAWPKDFVSGISKVYYGRMLHSSIICQLEKLPPDSRAT
ncbi:ABC multidrug transporter [Histoplasma capsulatum]|uniref:ABC multidrug transporter n=1 Tax=Ajellomyces capsulatus TaxID=5037 RepID=A0A8A1MK99_AJECA|nr:ABC multidrug transporter [Histoplasma capsulatum]